MYNVLYNTRTSVAVAEWGERDKHKVGGHEREQQD